MERKYVVKALLNSNLFKRPSILVGPSEVIGWWEARRLSYNLIVGAVALVTVLTMVVVSIICQELLGVPIGMPDPPIFAVLGIFAFGLMANVCFTGGWIVEILLIQLRGLRSSRFAEVAFGLGLLGSILLTAVPAVVTLVVGIGSLAGWFHIPSQPGEYRP